MCNVMRPKRLTIKDASRYDNITVTHRSCRVAIHSPAEDIFAHLMPQGVSSAPPSTCVDSPALASECPPGRWLHSCLLGHWTPFKGHKSIYRL